MLTRLDWKLRRIAAGYRQQDVAVRIGVSVTRYSALERGETEAKEWEREAVERLLPPLPARRATTAEGVNV
jgi:transcriptional regulator with XRE-family HTH domain